MSGRPEDSVSAFGAALAMVRRWEGGLVDHPRDPGGITRWGISLRFLRGLGLDVNGDGVVNGQDVRDLSEAEVAELYRRHFWAMVSAELLPPGVALAVFDGAVNQGPGRARRWLQKAAGAKVDGKIGPKTLAAVRARGTRAVLREFMVRRCLHYTGLGSFAVFGLGWLRRIWDVGLEAATWDRAPGTGHPRHPL